MNNIEPTAEERVKEKWPDAGACSLTSSIGGKIVRVKYIIQRDSNMAFNECEDDEDFLSKTCDTEQSAWQNALDNIKTPDTLSPLEEELLNKAIENNSKKTPSKDYRK